MIPELESESESKHGLLESELESESWILVNPGIGIRIEISPSGIGNGFGITGPGIIYNSVINYLFIIDALSLFIFA